MEQSREQPGNPHQEQPLPEGGLVPLVEFVGSQKANVLRACLESSGIYVHVWGEHLAITNIIWSIAGGYTKLLVPLSQLQEARDVLAAFARGELEIPDEGHFEPEEPQGTHEEH